MTARALRDGGSRFLSSAGAVLRPRALAVLGVLPALLVRRPLFGHESDDCCLHLTDRYGFLPANGGFAALRYDFDDLSFRFRRRALDPGECCVARVRLPECPIRRVVTGRHPGRSGRGFVRRVEFAPKFAPEFAPTR